MAAPAVPATPTTRTLTFNANVDTGAAGKRTVTAEIHSTTFDPDTTNNAASAEVTLSGARVWAPYFPGVTRSVSESAAFGSGVEDPVAAISPDGRALTYSLTGRRSNRFQVNSDGQIALAPNRTLDYEEKWEYPLVLSVSDGVNTGGEADSSIDDRIPVLIQVEHVEERPATVSISLLRMDNTTFRLLDPDNKASLGPINSAVDVIPLVGVFGTLGTYAVAVHSADAQDRDGARLVLTRLLGRFPRLERI